MRFDERAKFPTPGSDRVRDGRHLLEQEDGEPVFRVCIHFDGKQLAAAIAESMSRLLEPFNQRTGDSVV